MTDEPRPIDWRIEHYGGLVSSDGRYQIAQSTLDGDFLLYARPGGHLTKPIEVVEIGDLSECKAEAERLEVRRRQAANS